MILADKRDYRSGYNCHYAAYKASANGTHKKSGCLLLVYSVECGLKYLLLDKWREDNPRNIISNTADRRNNIIKTHSFENILKELGQVGTFSFPCMKTIHNDSITSGNFHEFCRYGINQKNGTGNEFEKYESELKKIAEWIKERMA